MEVNKLNILVVTNMAPSKQKDYAGIFVTKQVEYITRHFSSEVNLDYYTMKRTFTRGLLTITKYISFFAGFFPKLFKRYDIVHIHYLVPTIFLGWLYKFFHPKCRIIVTLHGRDITVQYKQYEWLLSFFCKKIDLLIPVGETLNELAEKYFPSIPKLVLPVGVDDEIFVKTTVEKEYDFIFLGSFSYRKGADKFIDALKLITDTRFKCLFIGSGDYRQDIAALQHMHDITILTGLSHVEIAAYLNKSKWLVLPSRNEGFPTATIEGFYCGVPLIGSDIPQILEQTEGKNNGFVFPLENIEMLKDTIIKAANIDKETYNKMSENAAGSFRHISISKVCAKIVDEYKLLSAN